MRLVVRLMVIITTDSATFQKSAIIFTDLGVTTAHAPLIEQVA